MKSILYLWVLLTLPAFAGPMILVSYYDAFDNAPFNNSEKIAFAIAKEFEGSTISVSLCPLNTVFDKSYGQLEDCIKNLKKEPVMVISLGEAKCEMKLEMLAQNFDRTMGPDNEGNEREGSKIILNGPEFNSMNYPLPQMYCSLEPRDRRALEISNNAGSFVCNNTIYQLNHYHPELRFGFIHVPAHNCRGLEKKNRKVVSAISTMLKGGIKFLSTQYPVSPKTPHTSNELRLPMIRSEINDLQNSFEKEDKCLAEFFKRARGFDE